MGGKAKSTKPRANASWVWNHFVVSGDGKYAKCKLCTVPGRGRLKISGTTTNFSNHLKSIHSLNENGEIAQEDDSSTSALNSDVEIVEDVVQERFPSTTTTKKLNHTSENNQSKVGPRPPNEALRFPIMDSFQKIASYAVGGKKHALITDAILFFIAKDTQPFDVVNQKGFQRLVHTMAPHYKIPARSTITDKISAKAQAMRCIQRESLKGAGNITLTSDLWTDSINSKNFMGTTIHFLRNNEFESIRLGVMRMTGAHTAENIAEHFEQILLSWNITKDQICAIVTDNAANMLKAARDFFSASKQLGCFAHSLNLVAIDSISQAKVQPTIDKVKAVVTFSRESVQVTEKLEKQQIAEGKKALKLKQDVVTRWNSSYLMLERFLVVAGYMRRILADFEKAPAVPNHDDLKIILDLTNCLKPFKEATEEMSGETYVTSSKVIPMVNCIRSCLNKEKPLTPQGAELKSKLLTNLACRFASIELNKIYAVATVLDPRFKTMLFESALATAKTIECIKKEAKNEMTRTQTHTLEPIEEEAPRTSKSSLWAAHEAALKKNQKFDENNPEKIVAAEMRMYIEGPLEQREKNPIQFWDENKYKLSSLYPIAMKYLPIVATSVPSERLFSTAGDIMTPERNRLSDKHLDDLLYLQSVPENTFFSK